MKLEVQADRKEDEPVSEVYTFSHIRKGSRRLRDDLERHRVVVGGEENGSGDSEFCAWGNM